MLCGSAQFDSYNDRLPVDIGLRLRREPFRVAGLRIGRPPLVEIWSHETPRLDGAMPEVHQLPGLVLQRSGRWAKAEEEYVAGLRKPLAPPQHRARLEALLDEVRRNIPEL